MTGKTFFNAVANGQVDLLELFLRILRETDATYCVIGGLAVNAYADPVVSLDLDLIVVSRDIDKVRRAAEAEGLKAHDLEHSINLSMVGSDLRIQLQTDSRYQAFPPRAVQRKVLGYEMNVAAIGDVLQGKLWAYCDPRRRASKRQKDLADILRLAETHPELTDRLPPELASQL